MNPASAAPTSPRSVNRLAGPIASEQPADATPQVIMMRASQIRAPNFCSARLLGISKAA